MNDISTTENEQVRAINDLRGQIQMNSYGLPTGFYRVDMLPFDDYEPNATAILVPRPPPIPKALETAPPITAAMGLEQLEEAIEVVETANAALEGDGEGVDEEEEEATFDPVTFEPLDVMNKEVRLREHPLIKPSALSGELIDHSVLQRTAGFLTTDLEGAFVALDYSEGFPTFENGDPFWTCLKYEEPAAYKAFVEYLEMSKGGKMEVELDSVLDMDLDLDPSEGVVDTVDPDNIRGATGVRSISHLAGKLERDDNLVLAKQEQLKEWYQLYYWEWRTKAFDMFRVVQFKSSQETRAMETQDYQYILARKMTLKATEYIRGDDFTDLLTPKIAMDMLRMSTQLERLSSGLSAVGGGAAGGEEPRVTSMQVSLRRVANNSRDDVEEESDGSSAHVLDQALMDPNKTEIIQDLILEMQLKQQG